ncbi:MAG: diguanylate cyclase [Aquabacterium sp.]
MTNPILPDPQRAADALIKATFEGAPDGLAVVDEQGRQLASNVAFNRLWQFAPDVLQRRDAMEMRAHVASRLSDPAAFMAHVAAAGLGPAKCEFDLIDGRVFERNATPLAESGFPNACIVRWRDVTARRTAESALQDALARLEAIFTHAINAILLADDQGRYLDANPAACTLLGRTRDQVFGLTVADVIDLPPNTAGAAWQAFLQQGASSGEVTLRRPDGSVRRARFSAVANIQPGVHLSVLTDATDELQARMRELETAAQMDIAMVNADIVFWSVDLLSGEVSSANQHRMQEMLGYTPDELPRGLAVWDALVHPDDFGRREASWQAHVDGRASIYEAEFRMRHKSGQWVWLLARGRALARDAQGRATRVVGTRIDITRRKLAEQQLETQAFTDSLTGILNRRRFLELAAVEAERAQRHGQPLALLMIDLDHFKSVNDRHGHAGGDAVLRAFVVAASTLMRSSDLFGRVGGEEFAALLPQTDLDGAAALAQRIQDVVLSHPVALPGSEVSYTVSIGVSVREAGQNEDSSVERLMLDADAALYRAKEAGRNRVLLAGPSQP